MKWLALCLVSLAVPASAAALVGAQAAPEQTIVPKWQIVGSDAGRLMVFGKGDSRPRRLTNGRSTRVGHSPSWSPDGRRVAFERGDASDPGQAVYVVNVADGQARQLKAGFPVAQDRLDVEDPITWSPDGRFIAVSHRRGFYVVPSHGGAVRRVHPGCDNDPLWWDTRSASWSPDGHQLAIACGRTLWVVAADGSERRRLDRTGEYGIGAASWSPDGRLIADGTRCGEVGHGDVMCDLTVIRPDGTGRRTLVRRNDRPTGPSDESPVWSSDGRLLVPIWGYNSRTVSVDPSTGVARTIHSEAVWNLTAGPNGTFAFTNDRPYRFEIHDRNGVRLLRRAPPIPVDDSWLG